MTEQKNYPIGSIEVVWGGMFSGKTEELLRRLKRAVLAKQDIQLFKPALDDRYHHQDVITHCQTQKMTATVVNSASEIFNHVKNGVRVIGIDEGQFFDDDLVEVCKILARQGKRVIIAGLDKTAEDQPFDPMPNLAAIADFCEKFHAICVECGCKASFSHRLIASTEKIQVGGENKYTALCRSCYNQKNYLVN